MPVDFDLNTIPCKNDSIMLRKVKDEVYLVRGDLDKESEEKLWVLNRIGFFIWDMMDGRRKSHEILNELVKQFDADPERIKKDFINLVLKLRDQGLLKLPSKSQQEE